jgi:hypothetical protein
MGPVQDGVLAPISTCKFHEAPQSSMHIMENNGFQFRHMVPSVIRVALLEHTLLMTEDQLLCGWWRAQSSAFLTETIQAVTALRKRELPFPLSQRVINARISRGEKHLEMRLVPPARFVDTAATLVALSPNALTAHTLLITADDKTTVQEGIRLGEATGLSVLHSRIDCMQGGQDRAMWMQQSDSTTRFYCHLLQLTLAPEADAYDAGSPDGAASPRRRRLRAGQWELFIYIYILGGRKKVSVLRLSAY